MIAAAIEVPTTIHIDGHGSVDAVLRYNATDPYAVEIEFPETIDPRTWQPTRWCISRATPAGRRQPVHLRHPAVGHVFDPTSPAALLPAPLEGAHSAWSGAGRRRRLDEPDAGRCVVTAPDSSRVEEAIACTRALYANAPASAAEYVADCKAAHELATARAEEAVAIALYHHATHAAALAAYEALKAADGGGAT